MKQILLKTKALTLEALMGKLQSAHILPLHYFTVGMWKKNSEEETNQILKKAWANAPLIVRSSALLEDGTAQSLAGKYKSVRNIKASFFPLQEAINQVITSYGHMANEQDQILIQPFLEDVTLSGVVSTYDASTSAPYYVINYETLGNTSSITSGLSSDPQTYYHARCSHKLAPTPLDKIIKLAQELEQITSISALDIEFAIDKKGIVYLFQVRPLTCKLTPSQTLEKHKTYLDLIAEKISLTNRAHPYLHGSRTVFGVMPDWNPAEIIGLRPKPLALSLYRDLITDSVWAYQRNNYGYKNLRSFPLLVHFHGLPYIDVRVSFNSFLPENLENDLADRLANYYINCLLETPTHHDKVEFEIIFSCYTFDLPERLEKLKSKGFSQNDIKVLTEELRQLTNRIVSNKGGLWKKDEQKISELERRQEIIKKFSMDPLSQIYWLLEDCKRYGTLPFAGLARAGFIAIQLLRSLVTKNILSREEYDRFMNSVVKTITRQMEEDYHSLGRKTFLDKYGHLRPGTYDIQSSRYDEAPDLYFDWNKKKQEHIHKLGEDFSLSLDQMKAVEKLLMEHGLEHELIGFFDFIKAGIQGREYSKFIFTKSLSEALRLLIQWGEKLGISRDDMAFLDIHCISELYIGSANHRKCLEESIAHGKNVYSQTQQIILPPLITSSNDAYSFHIPATEPNFITTKRVTAPLCDEKDKNKMKGSIVMIPMADPGYDWLFSHGIAGLVTAYGGINSHMAIRAGELGLPAVIGCGETLFNRWKNARRLLLDCASHRVEVIQ